MHHCHALYLHHCCKVETSNMPNSRMNAAHTHDTEKLMVTVP